MKVKLTRVWQGFLNHALEFVYVHVMVLDKKNKVIVIRICTAINFAQGNTVRVSDEDFQIPILPNANNAFFISLRQRHKLIQWDWLGVNIQLFCNL